MPTYNALDLISRALRETGYLSGTADPNAQDTVQGLNTLNGMLDSMGIDGEYVYTDDINTYALTSGTQEYDIGPSAAAPFVTTRPSRIINANIVDANGTRFPLSVINLDQRMSIGVPNIGASLPADLSYRPTMPNGKLWFYAKPAAGYSVELQTWAVLLEFTDLVTDANFPPGYYELLVYRLAQRFCTPGWGRGRSPEIDRLAGEATERVTSLNLNPTPLQSMDPRIGGVRSAGGMGGTVSQQWIDSTYIQGMYSR